MGIKQAFSLAVKSLMTSKLRSFLTMLGIIIGVGAVIILVSLINGFKSDMLNTFEDMGLNLINVNIMARGSNRQVSVEDMYIDGVNIGYEIHGNFDATFEFKNLDIVAYNK